MNQKNKDTDWLELKAFLEKEIEAKAEGLIWITVSDLELRGVNLRGTQVVYTISCTLWDHQVNEPHKKSKSIRKVGEWVKKGNNWITWETYIYGVRNYKKKKGRK